MKILRSVSRIIVGLTFVFSGFVKGVDPLGTTYKIEDYFIAYGADWAMDLALSLSFLLVLVEFMVGISLLFRIRIKLASTLLLLMMSFFTVVTLIDALYSPVPDCGCFGEAVKLTNWETFYKNIVLMVFTMIIVLTPSEKFKKPQVILRDYAGIIIAIGFLVFSWYSYAYLPPLDFRDWKVGNDMTQQGEPRFYLIYENLNTGEQHKYLSSELPWSDSVWVQNWAFVKQEVDYSSVVKPHNVDIVDEAGNDMTRQIIETDYYQFVVTSYDLTEASESGLKDIVSLYHDLDSEAYSVVFLTASLEEDIQNFLEENNTDIPVYQADDIELKSMVRSNPGLLLLKNGRILGKWHHHKLPTAKEIRIKYKSER